MSHSAGKTCQTAAALLTGPAHAPQKQHTYTRVQSNTYTSARWAEQRQPFSLCGLYVSADPALIQQTKLSLLNAQQKSSLSRHYAPVAPCSPSIHRPPSSPHIHSFTLTPDQCTHYTNCARRTLTVCMFCFSKSTKIQLFFLRWWWWLLLLASIASVNIIVIWLYCLYFTVLLFFPVRTITWPFYVISKRQSWLRGCNVAVNDPPRSLVAKSRSVITNFVE